MSVGRWSAKDRWGAGPAEGGGQRSLCGRPETSLQQGGLSIWALGTGEEATAVTRSHPAGSTSLGDTEGVGAVTQCSGRLLLEPSGQERVESRYSTEAPFVTVPRSLCKISQQAWLVLPK